MIDFTLDEEALIAQFSVPGGWDKDEIKAIKKKIKPFLLGKTSSCCCYCRRSMHSWHALTIDIEHVLPKGKKSFPQFTFALQNLSISCKRCNMGIKREDTSFFTLIPGDTDYFKSEKYEFIHPNLDVIDDHLKVLIVQFNNQLLIKYQVVDASTKGAAAYKYFKLGLLEVNSFDEAQGLDDVTPSESLPPEFARELQTVLDSITFANS